MPISAPPTIPLITDPSTFAERAQAWVVWQANDFYTGITDIAGLSGLPSSATSTTSNTIGTGSKSFTVETGRGFIAGQSLSIANTTTPTNRMFALVTSYNSGTGALVVNVQAIEGSGTFTAWSIALAFNAVVSQSQIGSNVAGNGPAFSAYASSTQSITSGAATKVTLGVENFDTNSNFASSRFTPTVAGYYQLNGTLYLAGTSITTNLIFIHKNGAEAARGIQRSSGTVNDMLVISALIYLNGTTDYVELYGVISGTSPAFSFATATATSTFSGTLVRAA